MPKRRKGRFVPHESPKVNIGRAVPRQSRRRGALVAEAKESLTRQDREELAHDGEYRSKGRNRKSADRAGLGSGRANLRAALTCP